MNHLLGRPACLPYSYHIMRLSVILVLVAIALNACDRTTPPAASNKNQFRVALLLPGSDTDAGWNQMAKQGLDQIAKDLGASTRHVTNVKTSDFEAQLDYFASEGFNVIICHGGEFEKEVAEAARRHPGTRFIVGGCPNAIKERNAVAVEFLARDASALAGLVAAQVTRSKQVAFVGAMEVPTLLACYEGFKDGASSADPAIKLPPPQWTESWDSPTRAKEKTESLLAHGADVIYQNVDAASRGVFEAVQSANKPGRPVYAFGCNSNQNSLAPDVILGSVVLDVPAAYRDLVKQAKENKLPSGKLDLGLRGGYVDLVLNDQHPAINPAIRSSVNDHRRRLLSR